MKYASATLTTIVHFLVLHKYNRPARWEAQISKCSRYALSSTTYISPALTVHIQFGMYIMFPIGIMYYFGVNLDSRFKVPDFWPKEGQTHRIPFEREEITEELQRLKQRRLAARAHRMAIEARGGTTEHFEHRKEELENPKPDILQAVKLDQPEKSEMAKAKGWSSWFK
jgi:protein PET100